MWAAIENALRHERHVVARRPCVEFRRDEVALAPIISLPQHTPMSPGPKPPKVSSSIAVRSARPPAARACHRRDVALVGLEKVQGQVSKGEEHVRQRRGLEVDAAEELRPGTPS